MKKTYHIPFLCFCFFTVAFLTIYFLGLFHIVQFADISSPDSFSYLDAANNLKNGCKPHPLRPYAYPGFLCFLQMFSNKESFFLLSVYLFQLLLLLSSFLLLYRIICFYCKSSYAVLAVLLLILHVSFYVYACLVHTEIFFIFLATLLVYFSHLFFIYKKDKYIEIVIFISCIACLVRPGFLYITLLLCVVTMLWLIKNKNYSMFLCTIVIFFATIGTQCYNIKKQYGNYKISYIDDVAQYRYLNNTVLIQSDTTKIVERMNTRNAFFDSLCYQKNKDASWAIIHAMAKEDTKQLIQKSWSNYIHGFYYQLKENAKYGNYFLRDLPKKYIRSEKIQQYLIAYTKGWNILYSFLLITVCSFSIFRCNKKNYIAYILLFFCFYHFIISGISNGEGDRFNIVWMPMFITAFFILFFRKKAETDTTNMSNLHT